MFELEVAHPDASKHTIRPYDPHNDLHHLTHKDQSRERGQRSHEDATFYERICQALLPATRIAIAGRGHGQSDAARHLITYIAAHHTGTSARVLPELTADLSHITEPQLLALGREAFK